jgi:hypothetical protein
MKRASWRIGMVAVMGSLVFLGVPLVSWGIGNGGGFFTRPARVAYCVVVALVMVAALKG